MRRPKTIEKFIRECFEELSINYKEYFYYLYDEGQYEDILWTDEHGKIDKNAVVHASRILGISVNDLMATNNDALLKWLRKYPYFWKVKPFEVAYEASLHGNEFESARALEVIFDTKIPEIYTNRYDYDDVVRRLISQLKEYDKALPGTFHKGAKITKLTIDTVNFCHFDEIKEMTESYLEMANRVVDLFLKAICAPLSEEEMQEYNLLVSVFGLRDKYYTKGYLYYDYLLQVKELYTGVTNDNFFDDLLFKKSLDFKPWKCAEFISDVELVKKYLNVFPQAKAEMRSYAMRTSHFACEFVWSDAQLIEITPEDETMWKTLGEDPIPDEDRAKERTLVYVEKTAEELRGDNLVAEKISKYCRPEKLGGIPVLIPNYSRENCLVHIGSLFKKVPNSNYVEQIVNQINDIDGGNE